jgi:hypothetical protein
MLNLNAIQHKKSIELDLEKIDFKNPNWFVENFKIKNYKEQAVKPHPYLEESPIHFFGTKYKYIVEPYLETIYKNFQDSKYLMPEDPSPNRSMTTRIAYNGPEIELIRDAFEKEFGIKPDSFVIVKNQKTDIKREDRNAKHWDASYWHIDLNEDDSFQFIMYLNDVTDETGPFEYAYPPENYVYAHTQLRENGIHPENYQDVAPESRKVIGPAGTSFLMVSNMLHRGNYAYDRDRIALTIGFKYIY